MIDPLATVVGDVAFDVAARVVDLARDKGIPARCQEADDRCANDEIGEIAHGSRITEGCFPSV